MTDFTKILDKAKELEAKMKESQEKIKEIKAEGVSARRPQMFHFTQNPEFS